MSSFASYATEKKLSKHPEEFGQGAIEGVAGPETANNAAAGGAFVPMLALGIPPNPLMALLLGALIIHGITPGPLLMAQHPDVFWGVIASMYMGNVMLLILNLPPDRYVGQSPECALQDAHAPHTSLLPHRFLCNRKQHNGYYYYGCLRNYRVYPEEK